VLIFGLKNVSDMYQWVVNYMFHDLIGLLVEIYIDNVIVKFKGIHDHLSDLRRILERTRIYGLKMNLNKCVFSVSAS
jgi:hypothetical protein